MAQWPSMLHSRHFQMVSFQSVHFTVLFPFVYIVHIVYLNHSTIIVLPLEGPFKLVDKNLIFCIFFQWFTEKSFNCSCQDPEGPHNITWSRCLRLCVPSQPALGVFLWGWHDHQVVFLIQQVNQWRRTEKNTV